MSSRTAFAAGRARPAPAAGPVVNEIKINEIYSQCLDSDNPDRIELEGISRLCELVELDAEDIKTLVLLWKLGANSRPGTLTREEFLNGMKKLGVDTLPALKALIPSFDPGFLMDADFRSFYKFVFQFSREGTHKTIDREFVVQLMKTVLSADRAPHFHSFIEYLETLPASTRIGLDQWDLFLTFSSQVKLDFSNHDPDGAWPVLLDDYAEWAKQKTRASSSGGGGGGATAGM